jgi:Snf7
MEDFNDINEALGRNFATPDDISEGDLEAELEMLEDELEEEALAADSTPAYLQASSLPDTPTTELPSNYKVDQYGLPAVPN